MSKTKCCAKKNSKNANQYNTPANTHLGHCRVRVMMAIHQVLLGCPYFYPALKPSSGTRVLPAVLAHLSHLEAFIRHQKYLKLSFQGQTPLSYILCTDYLQQWSCYQMILLPFLWFSILLFI